MPIPAKRYRRISSSYTKSQPRKSFFPFRYVLLVLGITVVVVIVLVFRINIANQNQRLFTSTLKNDGLNCLSLVDCDGDGIEELAVCYDASHDLYKVCIRTSNASYLVKDSFPVDYTYEVTEFRDLANSMLSATGIRIRKNNVEIGRFYYDEKEKNFKQWHKVAYFMKPRIQEFPSRSLPKELPPNIELVRKVPETIRTNVLKHPLEFQYYVTDPPKQEARTFSYFDKKSHNAEIIISVSFDRDHSAKGSPSMMYAREVIMKRQESSRTTRAANRIIPQGNWGFSYFETGPLRPITITVDADNGIYKKTLGYKDFTYRTTSSLSWFYAEPEFVINCGDIKVHGSMSLMSGDIREEDLSHYYIPPTGSFSGELRKTQSKGASIKRVDVTISDVIAETSENMNALVAVEEDNVCDVVCFMLCHERIANFVYSLSYWQAIEIEATTVFNFRNVQRQVTLNRHIRQNQLERFKREREEIIGFDDDEMIDENKNFFLVKILQFTNVPFGTYSVEASHRFSYKLVGKPRHEGSDAFSVTKTFVVKDSKRHVIKVELDR